MTTRTTPQRVLFFFLIVLDLFLWQRVIAASYFQPTGPRWDFLDVGQGDSVLFRANDVSILTDAGPDGAVRRALEKALPRGTRYIDIGIITHPELDHFGGFNALLDRYDFGLMILNGRMDAHAREAWTALVESINERRIPVVTLGAGDRIRIGESAMHILSPSGAYRESGAMNDTGIITLIETPHGRMLSMADVDTNIEQYLLKQYDLRADILKVGHHGSKYSSDATFLAEAQPAVAVISSGAKNRYGHPAPETLERLRKAGITVLKTATQGTVTLEAETDGVRIRTEK